MSDVIDRARLIAMLNAAASALREGRVELAALDAATGDGDHGTAMGKVADAIERCAGEASPDVTPGALLKAVGLAVMGIDAGSTGPLYGSLFLGLGEGAADAAMLDAACLAVSLEHGRAKLRTCTKAEPGDKTMIDALVPAAEAVLAAAGDGCAVADALTAAASAARSGADTTADLPAKFGRARNLGERSIGHVDPGAASMALLFEGFNGGFADG